MDYDPGVSFVNQLNRNRLMMATANKLLKEENVKKLEEIAHAQNMSLSKVLNEILSIIVI